MNITIGEKKTFDDWGLLLQSLTISMPEAKISQVDIPGANGMIDLTEAMGTVKYNNRVLQMIFDVPGDLQDWHGLTSQIGDYLHGKRLKIILDTDPEYYYIGRLSLNSEKSSYLINRITITGDMEPYKYELLSSLEDWLWDPFDFETGLIREYKDLVVNGTLKVDIPGTRKEVLPTFTTSKAMQVEWKGVKYDLPAGTTKLYAISIPEGDHELIFYGNGIVSIDYRGGIL